MSAPQFTPAPWSLGQIDDGEQWIDAKNGSPARHVEKWMGLATVVVEIEYDPEGSAEGKANARLIAAAPELYEALEAVMGAIDYVNALPGEKGREIVKAAHRALTKARGQ